MSHPKLSPSTTLRVRRVFEAPRERVFQAWTAPAELAKWWRVADGYSTPIAEVDLRVGGQFRLGMQAPGSNEIDIVTGTFKIVTPPVKLVYTWLWEGSGSDRGETLVTVEFHDLDGKTEVILTHERFRDDAERELHSQGWQGCLDQLEVHLGTKGVSGPARS